MQPIMLARVAHVLPFTDVLHGIGAPVERELRRAGLPTMLESQPDAYVPVLPVLNFFQRMEHQEGIDDIAFLASQQESIDHLSGDFIKISESLPTLYARLQLFCKFAHLENTNSKVSLSREGSEIRIFSNLVGHAGLDRLRYSEWIQIMVLIEIIRETAGSNWRPTEITFQSRFSPCRSVLEEFPDTRFLFGQKDTSFKAPITLMMRPLRVRHSNQNEQLPVRTVLDFPGSLKLALRTYLQEGCPDIHLAAEIANTSVRTLQRRLAGFGISYSILAQHARFESAVDLLKDPDHKSLDIARAAGYRDPSNFARAFRRIAGVSPREYRRQQDAD
jgi:AraC-like DNA-binding protein